MFRFENPDYLYALLLLPLLVLLYIWLSKRRQQYIAGFGNYDLVSRLLKGFSERRRRIKGMLLLTCFALLLIALANPQLGAKTEKVTRRGIDVMIALDVSQSMLAEDVQPNRLERSKQLMAQLIERMKDDRIGIVVFAGTAFLQMPLSSDYSAAKLFLQSINTDMMPTQGTAIGQAIDIALQSYKNEEKKHKALVIISDGEDHEEGAMTMAQQAAEQGTSIYAVGVGSDEGGKIPVIANGRRVSNKLDENGQEVVSRLNENALRELADAADGSYFRLSDARNDASRLIDELGKVEKRDFEERVFTDYADHFQWFVGAALVVLLIDLLLAEAVFLNPKS